MTRDDRDDRWRELTRLLEPIHEAAATTARNVCRCPADGDDLYQEAVLRAYLKLHTLKDASRFRSWFFAVLLSLHRSRSRRGFWKRFLPLPPDGELDERIGSNAGPREEDRLGAARMSRALSRLPAVQREAVVLHEIEGFSMEEIAEMQGASVAAVKSRVLRGRERLRRFYASAIDSPAGTRDGKADTTLSLLGLPGERPVLLSSTIETKTGGGRHA